MLRGAWSLALASAAGLSVVFLPAQPAVAHRLAEWGLLDGALHPLSGLDHLLLLLGVGALIAWVDRMLLLPALVGAVVGAVFGAGGGSIPSGELLAALSVSALGLLLLADFAGGDDSRRTLAGAVVGSAVAIHALLHGREGSGDVFWWIGTATSAIAVVLLSSLILRRADRRLHRVLAVVLAAAGLLLAWLPIG